MSVSASSDFTSAPHPTGISESRKSSLGRTRNTNSHCGRESTYRTSCSRRGDLATHSGHAKRANSRGLEPREMRDASAGCASRFRRARSLRCQPLGELACPISDDNVCAGAFERSHDLQDGSAFLYNPFFGRRFDHRVFTAHMVNGGRFSKMLTDPPKNVDVRQRWLYHYDVRAFVDIQSNFTQRFLRVRVIHLVRTTIAKLRRALGSVAERPVKSRRKFGGITHD